jgi:two-component system, cell cycle response regulator DivK
MDIPNAHAGNPPPHKTLSKGFHLLEQFRDLLCNVNGLLFSVVGQDTMSKVILQVEDNHYNVRLVAKMLHGASYQTVSAADGSIGVQMAMTLRPDLILMDLELPVMGGVQAMQLIKSSSLRKTPIIAMTAEHVAPGVLLAKGFDAVLLKPVTRQELLTTLAEFLTDKPKSTPHDDDQQLSAG